MASKPNGDGKARILRKLENRLEVGDYYEAHQIYRTLNFRYCAQQKYNEAIDLLMKGSMALLTANQMASGADLALLMVTAMETSHASVNRENIEKLVDLHRRMENDPVDRPNYVTAAVRWSRQNSSSSSSSATSSSASSANPSSLSSPVSLFVSGPSSSSRTVGHPHLHGGFAKTFWNERDYCQSRYHFIRSEDGEGCASMLIEYQITCGYPSEIDLFVAQAVFQYLCLRNKATAEMCFRCYTERHPQVQHGPPFVLPLLNFVWLLLLAVDGGSLSVFSVLCSQYEATLNQDSSYYDYLAKIGQVYFHLPTIPTAGSPSLFGNFLPGMMGFEDDFDDDQPPYPEPYPIDLD